MRGIGSWLVLVVVGWRLISGLTDLDLKRGGVLHKVGDPLGLCRGALCGFRPE